MLYRERQTYGLHQISCHKKREKIMEQHPYSTERKIDMPT